MAVTAGEHPSEVIRSKEPAQAVFVRDRLTWLSYLLYGFWSLAWGLVAPIMPFLREDLKLSYSTAALHFSGLALGLLCAGLSGAHILARTSRTRAIWAGTAAVAVATLSFAAASNYYATIFATLVIGFSGSIAAQAIIGGLSERHPLHRPVAISELVVTNSLFAALAPLVVAAMINLHLHWKFAVMVPLIALASMCWITGLGGGASWTAQQNKTNGSAQLPATYWLYFAIVFLTVAAEWSIAFWCPDYLERVLKFSRTDACTGLSAFLFAMLAGRAIGSRLASKASTNTLLIAATLLAIAGFLFFWRSQHPIAVYAGLVLLGLGQSNCYPLALTAAISVAPEKTTEATAKMSISTGSAILLAPLVLGLAADQIGIAHAYGIVAVLLVVAAVTAFWSAAIIRAKEPALMPLD